MDGYGETPPAGEYTLLVKRYDEIVDSITFDFEGSDVEVLDVETSWEYFAFLDYYSLDEVTVIVANEGDLPAYVDEIDLELDSETETLYIFNGAIPPGKEAELRSSVYITEVEAGKYELKLKLKDSAGEILARYSTSVRVRG